MSWVCNVLARSLAVHSRGATPGRRRYRHCPEASGRSASGRHPHQRADRPRVGRPVRRVKPPRRPHQTIGAPEPGGSRGRRTDRRVGSDGRGATSARFKLGDQLGCFESPRNLPMSRRFNYVPPVVGPPAHLVPLSHIAWVVTALRHETFVIWHAHCEVVVVGRRREGDAAGPHDTWQRSASELGAVGTRGRATCLRRTAESARATATRSCNNDAKYRRSSANRFSDWVVPEVRLELTRACAHRCLRPTRLPIPPLRRGEPSL